jgi:hypothetical protein
MKETGMSKKEDIVSSKEMGLMHKDLLRSAEARAQLPSINFDRISKTAAEAYRAGSRRPEATEREMAYAANAAIVTRQMKQLAMMDVGRLIENGEAATSAPRGWVTDLLSAFVVPASLVGLVYILESGFGNFTGKVALALSGVAFIVLALLTASQIFRSHSLLKVVRFKEGAPSTFSTFSWQSGGSIAAGLFVLLVGGLFTIRETDQQSVQKLEASTRQLNKAMAWAIAARQAGADRETISRVVADATEIQWNAASSWPTQTGMLVASAEIPRLAHAEVRLSDDPSRARDSVRLRNGETKYTDYFVGKVIAANLSTVTVMPSSGVKRTINLPQGEPAPPIQSVIVMALRKGKNEATFIQAIDTAVADLKAK